MIRALAVCSVFAANGGCSVQPLPDAGAPDASRPHWCPPEGDAGCVEPFDGFCNGRECPSWATTAAEARAAIDCGRLWWEIALGTCGPYLYVIRADGYGGFEMYFDVSGALVGALSYDDTDRFCRGTSFVGQYGYVPCCEPVIRERTCIADHADLGSRD
jgi:hypothetical protein